MRAAEQQRFAAERALVQKERQQCALLEGRVRALRGDLHEATARARWALDKQEQQQAQAQQDAVRAEAEEAQEHQHMLALHSQLSCQAHQGPRTDAHSVFSGHLSLFGNRGDSYDSYHLVLGEESRPRCFDQLLGGAGDRQLGAGDSGPHRGVEVAPISLPTQPASVNSSCHDQSQVECMQPLCDVSDVAFLETSLMQSSSQVARRVPVVARAGKSAAPMGEVDEGDGDVAGLGKGSENISPQSERATARARLRHELRMLHQDVSLLAREGSECD